MLQIPPLCLLASDTGHTLPFCWHEQPDLLGGNRGPSSHFEAARQGDNLPLQPVFLGRG